MESYYRQVGGEGYSKCVLRRDMSSHRVITVNSSPCYSVPLLSLKKSCEDDALCVLPYYEGVQSSSGDSDNDE